MPVASILGSSIRTFMYVEMGCHPNANLNLCNLYTTYLTVGTDLLGWIGTNFVSLMSDVIPSGKHESGTAGAGQTSKQTNEHSYKQKNLS